MKVQSFDDFLAENSTAEEPDHSFLRGRANVSTRQQKNQDQQYRKEVESKYDERAVLKQKYDELVASGEIRPPTRIESLIQTAKGHPDNPATLAAQRLLDKKGIDYT